MNPPGQRRGQVVVVNGPAGVGKTTVSRRLAAAVPNGTCIHGDALRDFIVTRGPDRPAGLTYLAAAALAEVHLLPVSTGSSSTTFSSNPTTSTGSATP